MSEEALMDLLHELTLDIYGREIYFDTNTETPGFGDRDAPYKNWEDAERDPRWNYRAGFRVNLKAGSEFCV